MAGIFGNQLVQQLRRLQALMVGVLFGLEIGYMSSGTLEYNKTSLCYLL